MNNESNIHKENMWWVYSLPLARWLIENGFTCYRTVPDLVKPRIYNFLFKDSCELHESIRQYEKIKN